ncbi:MAG: tetratricopeptide repeat protein [Streptosporangiaceae bacterium]
MTAVQAWGEADGQVVVGAIPRRSPGFLPRPGLLARLDRADPGVQVITGLPGAGKTQLAAAYARSRLAGGWRLVAWVDAEDTASLLAGLAAVADAAGLSDGGSGRDAAAAARAVRRLLETDGECCLLVLDDAADPEAVRPFVPAGGAAQVLLTSTRLPPADLGTSVRVEVFTEEEALAVLAGRTGLGEEGAVPVAARLGYLPLALAQATEVIAREHLGYGTYLNRVRTLPAAEHIIPDQDQPYPYGVAQAVLLALDAVRAGDAGDACITVMEIMAVLSAAGVHRELLQAIGQAGVPSRRRGRSGVSPPLVDHALERLAERSLVSVSLDGQTVTAHRLVLRVVRERLARRGRLAAMCLAVASVLGPRMAGGGARDHEAASDIPRQATALLENAAGSPAEADGELARMLRSLLDSLNSLAGAYRARGRPAEAVPLFGKVLAGRERLLGPDHRDTLNARNKLANTCREAGRPTEALLLHAQTLGTRMRLLGADHRDTLTSQNNLAAAYHDAGRAAEAIPLFEHALAGRERLLGPDHPSTLNSRANLAAAYWEASRAADAVVLLAQTLAARERLLGSDHPDTVKSRSDLADAYGETGRAAEAVPLLEQILASRERLLGPDHADTLQSRNDLADSYRQAGQVAKAIPQIEHVAAARERLLGADHPRTLRARNNLAAAYRAAGRAADAIPLLEQTLAACERLLGPDDPRTVTTRHNLDLAQRDAGQAE